MRPEAVITMDVRHSDVGADGRARLTAVGGWLQETAGHSADALGFGEDVLRERGLTWVLVRQQLRIRRLPAAGERLRVRTWPSSCVRLGWRGYEIFDAAGRLLLEGVSGWAVMELRSRSLCSLPHDLLRAYPADVHPVESIAARAPARVPAVERESPLRVRHDDVDINGHVNNACYLSWLAECLPQEERSTLSLLDISYRAETFPGEELISVCGAAEPDGQGFRRALAIRRPDGVDACRAAMRWECGSI